MTLRDTLASIAARLGLAGGGGAKVGEEGPGAGQQLRLMLLGLTAARVGLSPTPEYPRLFGVAMDWPVGGQIATVVSLADGTASLYTTSSSGVLGGHAHEPARRAAKRFVSAAQPHFDGGAPATTFPYPPETVVRFYLLGYDGVRSIDGQLDAVSTGTAPLSPLFAAGQDVLSELRQIAEKQG